MGNLFSKKNNSIDEAKMIKQDLYARINQKKIQHQKDFKSIPNEKKYKILLSDANQLTQMMDSHQVTSLQILLSFIERTINFGVPNNYVMDQMFQQAIHKAIQCDQIRKKHPKKKSWRYGMNKTQCFPPFFGVPCSLKQTILVKGRQSYAGFVSKFNQIPQQDTAYMELLKGMGLIPFVRSNVPQACKTFETNNHIFGYCKNPRNETRSCGGSSGGQGGLVGSYCSPFGIGSDIGGSLRIPAQFNGLFTIKSSGRNDRHASAFYGRFCGGYPVAGQPGPLTHSTQDLIIYSHYIFDEQNYESIHKKKIDHNLVLKKFDQKIFEENPKLKIGYLDRLDTLRCSKSHQKAVAEVINTLNELGHSTMRIQLPQFEQLYLFTVKLFISNQNISVLDQMRQNQPFIKQYKVLHLITKIPWIIKRVIIWLIKKKQPRVAKVLSLSKPMNCKDVLQSIYDIQVDKARKIKNIFIDNELDAMVMPGFALPAPKLGEIQGLQYCLAFNTGWNVIHYPAGNLPVRLVLKNETKDFTDQFNDIYTKNMRISIQGTQGMTVGVQVISMPRNEETILYIMNQLQKKIEFNKKYALPLKI